MRAVRAELAKMLRPLCLWAVAAFAAISCLLVWGAQANAHANANAGVPPVFPCSQIVQAPGSTPRSCASVQAEERAFQAHMRRQQRLGLAQAAAGQSPLGAGGLAADEAATLLGAVIVGLVAAGHTAGEWREHTIASALIANSRRWRFVLLKAFSTWLVGIASLVLGWAALAALAPVFHHSYPLRGGAGPGAGSVFAEIGAAMLVMACYSVLATLAATLTRSPLGAFFLTLAALVGSFFAAKVAAVAALSLPYWVTGLLALPKAGYLNLFWPTTFPHAVPTPGISFGALGLLAFIAVGTGAAVLRLTYSDLDR